VSTDGVHSKGSTVLLIEDFTRGSGFGESGVKPGSLVYQVEDSKNEEGKSDEAEAKYLTTSEGSEETNLEVLLLSLNPNSRNGNIFVLSGLLSLIGLVLERRVEELVKTINVFFISIVLGNRAVDGLTKAAVVGGSGIGEDGNLHTNISRSNGSEGTDEERDGSVGEVRWEVIDVHLVTLVGLVNLGGVNGETNDKGEYAAEER
jgi:hypothetical protein